MAALWTRFVTWLQAIFRRKQEDAPAMEASSSTIEKAELKIPPAPASLSAPPDIDSETEPETHELPPNPMDSIAVGALVRKANQARGRSDWEKSHNAVATSVGEVRHQLELMLHEQEKSASSHADKRFYQRLGLLTRERDPKLPPYPRVASELARLVDDPKFKMRNLVELIERDPALIRAVWLQASSVVHGQPPRTLAAAVSRLGADALWRIAMTTVLRAASAKVEGFEDEVAAVQEHGFIASDVAVFITGDRRGAPFLAGLLNSVGKLVIYDAARADRSGTRPSREVVERMVHRYHSSFGMLVGSAWKLDKGVIQAIGFHGTATPPAGIDKKLCRSVARACLVSEAILQVAREQPLTAIPPLSERCSGDEELTSLLTVAGMAWSIFELGRSGGRTSKTTAKLVKKTDLSPSAESDPDATKTAPRRRRPRGSEERRRRRKRPEGEGTRRRRSAEGRPRRDGQRKRRRRKAEPTDTQD